MKISIIVPAFNEERLIGETLCQIRASTAAFDRHGWQTEFVVCDNNSTDRTAELSREAGASVVFESVNQIARARNRGAEAATGNWLIFVDADSHPSAELFADVAAKIQSGTCLAGGSTIRLNGHYPLANCVTWLWNRLSRSRRLLAGSFIFCDAAAFRKVGGFSHELFAGEELDLSKRLRQLGHETGLEIVILHRHPLLTSARKMHLYSGGEHIRFLFRAAFNYRQTITDRNACHQWYDGRR